MHTTERTNALNKKRLTATPNIGFCCFGLKFTWASLLQWQTNAFENLPQLYEIMHSILLDTQN